MKLENLPIFDLSRQEICQLQSFNGMVEKIKQTGKMLFSFSMENSPMLSTIENAKSYFKTHFKELGNTFETKSCIPNTTRMNLEVDINKFDAFEVLPTQSVKSVFSNRLKQNSKNIANANSQMLFAISKKFKIILFGYSNENSKYINVFDDDMMHRLSFPVGSLAEQITEVLNRRMTVTQPMLDELKIHDEYFIDNVESPLTKTIYYNSMTYTLMSPFTIDMPMMSSIEDLSLLCPLHELAKLKKNVQDAEKNLQEAQVMYDKAEDRVESVLIDFDVNSQKHD